MAYRAKRIVDLFYRIQDVAKDEHDAVLVSLLKDCEMYLNILLKIIDKSDHEVSKVESKEKCSNTLISKRSVEILKHWIYFLSSTKNEHNNDKLLRNQQARDLLGCIKIKSIKPPFDNDPENFNLLEYSERTLILPKGTSKSSRTRALKSHKRGGRTGANKPKLQKSLSKTSLSKGILAHDTKAVKRTRKYSTNKDLEKRYTHACAYAAVNLPRGTKKEHSFVQKTIQRSSLSRQREASKTIIKHSISKPTLIQGLYEESGRYKTNNFQLSHKPGRGDDGRKSLGKVNTKSQKNGLTYIKQFNSLNSVSRLSPDQCLNRARSNIKREAEKCTPQRSIALSPTENLASQPNSHLREVSGSDRTRAGYNSESYVQRYRRDTKLKSMDASISEFSQNKIINNLEIYHSQHLQESQFNFGMKRSVDEESEVRFGRRYKYATFLEESGSFISRGEEEKHLVDTVQKPSRIGNQKTSHIIPFQEFIKQKEKAEHLAPSKISMARKPGLPGGSPGIQRSPALKKYQKNNYQNYLQPKARIGDSSQNNKTTKAEYLYSLKTKFSPLVEVSLEDNEIIVYGKAKPRVRQPKQKKMLKGSSSHKSIPEGITSQERSKEEIKKVANGIKNKLKHNYRLSKEGSLKRHLCDSKNSSPGSLKNSSSYAKRRMGLAMEEDFMVLPNPQIGSSRKKRAVTTSDIIALSNFKEGSPRSKYQRLRASKKRLAQNGL
ncbi:unnamed protein product [Moneuplotes crassus]|uniref:Uncharacterized protein n=1 Tax=Euplotes crassus TaxID=5936 RepID=A0AAD1U326_EUPCR|nr:unnamed protein product [Moneuplotes crassus]